MCAFRLEPSRLLPECREGEPCSEHPVPLSRILMIRAGLLCVGAQAGPQDPGFWVSLAAKAATGGKKGSFVLERLNKLNSRLFSWSGVSGTFQKSLRSPAAPVGIERIP